MKRDFMVTMDFINPQFFARNCALTVLRRIEGDSVIHVYNTPARLLDTHQHEHDRCVDFQVLVDFLSALRGIFAYLFLLEYWRLCFDIPDRDNGFTAYESNLLLSP